MLFRSDLDTAAEQLRLTWLSTSRGSNAAKDRPGLICYGTPRANLSATIARYCLMAGQIDISTGTTLTPYPLTWGNRPGYWGRVITEADHDAFAEFYHVRTQAEIWQGYNRLRHAIRPGETLEVIHVTEYPLGPSTTVLEAAELLNESATNINLTSKTIVEALEQLQQVDRPLTQVEAAAHLGVNLRVLTHFNQRSGIAWADLVELASPPRTAESIEKPVESVTTQTYKDLYKTPLGSAILYRKIKGFSDFDPDPTPPPGSTPAAIDAENTLKPGIKPVTRPSHPATVEKGV